MESTRKRHWEKVWSTGHSHEVSWYQEAPVASLGLIDATGINRDDRILDVGGGASTLVDGLLDRGFENLSVLDISASAINHARARLGARSDLVTWKNEDVTEYRAEAPFAVWHDRAVLHFLTNNRDRELYVRSLTAGLAPAGHVIIATFALDGPKKCSGLKTCRYGPREITALLGEKFQLLEIVHETHLTPAQTKQRFTYFRLQRQN